MTDITDPVVLRSLANRWRPRAEQLVALQMYLNNDATDYTENIAGPLGAYIGSDPVIDGRTAEGVATVTKANITSLLQLLSAIRAELVSANVPELLEKFSVREPRIELGG